MTRSFGKQQGNRCYGDSDLSGAILSLFSARKAQGSQAQGDDPAALAAHEADRRHAPRR